MGKVNRLHNRVELFAKLFRALGIVLANTWPCTPAQHHSTAVHKAGPYMVIVGSIFKEDAPAIPPFSYLYLIYLWQKATNLVPITKSDSLLWCSAFFVQTASLEQTYANYGQLRNSFLGTNTLAAVYDPPPPYIRIFVYTQYVQYYVIAGRRSAQSWKRVKNLPNIWLWPARKCAVIPSNKLPRRKRKWNICVIINTGRTMRPH